MTAGRAKFAVSEIVPGRRSVIKCEGIGYCAASFDVKVSDMAAMMREVDMDAKRQDFVKDLDKLRKKMTGGDEQGGGFILNYGYQDEASGILSVEMRGCWEEMTLAV